MYDNVIFVKFSKIVINNSDFFFLYSKTVLLGINNRNLYYSSCRLIGKFPKIFNKNNKIN